MYAIFEDGSRQYRVSEGDVVRVDYREVEVGSRIEFPRVLLCAAGSDVKVGQPTVEGMKILGTVLGQPSTKIFIQHFRRRKNYRRLKGHRQHYVELKVTNILLPGQTAPPMPEKAPAPVS
ncbi:MAG: 50S ribosomal protein L21 [Planctomycetes bacterium]|nr:50S ribosomal protein L21 [Planctomycetota bacterium]